MNCPTCGKAMTKRDSHDVEIDMCADHGIWLDKGELRKIVDEADDRARAAIPVHDGDRRRGRFEGIFLGWLSFFLPD